MTSIREMIIARLDPKVRALHDEIEEKLGRHIKYAYDQWRECPAVAVQFNLVDLRIHHRDISSQEVLHELLHAKRYLIDKVPKLVPKVDNPNDSDMMAVLENEIEHVAIVPMEADYGYDPYPYWNELCRTRWKKYPWAFSGNVLRTNVMLGVLNLTRVNDQVASAYAWDVIRKSPYKSDAENLFRRIQDFQNDKPKLGACVMRFLKIPRNDVLLLYNDADRQRQYLVELPLH
ncbi:hypothetical protein QTA58_00180 [Neorhizobium sp. CSC1952]|uniref:hypothetical protein n=1 Tax=Neorhizobium sp. CSC1952 TaxID=2978974 RepID=UPI0025A5F421|nr:hypothetical protein [Rhizobium sp. CSC1952]WJR67226.1 hypothetical protein QTA58_00180 [Rhizobium sp. CSC1952]